MILLWALGIVGYLLIGGIIYAAMHDEDDELSAVIFAWPMVIVLYALIFGLEACKAFGRLVVNLFNRFIYEGVQNEKQE